MLEKKLRGVRATLVAMLAFALALGIVNPMAAQGGNFSIRGKVLDEKGQPIAGALIEVTGTGLSKERTTATDLQGNYLIPALPAGGEYDVKVSALGYGAIIRKQVKGPAGALLEASFSLGLAQTVVEVNAGPPPSRTTVTPSTGGVVYQMTQEAIQALPQGENTPLPDVLVQEPGVVLDVNGALHVRGDEAHLQYRLNGILLPEGLGGFGSALETRMANRIDLITGALPAQYKYRTAGVVDIHTKTGSLMEGALASLYGGSHNTWSPSLEFGNASGDSACYVMGTWIENDLGIVSPVPWPNPVHDHTDQGRGFGYFTFPVTPSLLGTLAIGTAVNQYQIPSPPGQEPVYHVAGVGDYLSQNLDENQHEVNHWAVFALQGQTGSALSYQLAAFSRYSRIHYSPDPAGDLIYNGVASDSFRSSFTNGLQGDVTWWTNGRHTIRAGFDASAERAIADDTNAVLPGKPGYQTSDVPFSIVDDHAKTAWLYGIYLQDEWRCTDQLTLNYGARADLLNGYTHASQFSPRLNAIWRISSNDEFHAGYARYFTPPPTELIQSTSFAKFENTTAAPLTPLNSPASTERTHVFDLGFIHRFSPELQFSLDTYYKLSSQLIDEGQFGQAFIYAPINWQKGRIYGVEMAWNYQWNALRAYLNATNSAVLGKNVTSGQFNFEADELAYMADHWTHLDRDQNWTFSGGLSYQISAVVLTLDGFHGSGYRSGFANTTIAPATFQVNLGGNSRFKAGCLGELEGRFSVVNLFDRVNLLRDGTGIGVFAKQYLPRRAIYLTLSKKF